MNEIAHVSSIDDRVKRQKLNNVLDSLNDLVDYSTNDKTKQDYGQIQYCGNLVLGQEIQGTKKPRRQDVPIVTTSNAYVGMMQPNGSVMVENGYTLSASCTSCTCKQARVSMGAQTLPWEVYPAYNCCCNDSYCWTDCCNGAHVEGINCHIICCPFYGMIGYSVNRKSDGAWVGTINNSYNYRETTLMMCATLWNGLLFVNTDPFVIGCFDIEKEDIILNGETVATCGQRALDAQWPGQFYVTVDWGTPISYAMCIRTTKCIDIDYTKCPIENSEINEDYV